MHVTNRLFSHFLKKVLHLFSPICTVFPLKCLSVSLNMPALPLPAPQSSVVFSSQPPADWSLIPVPLPPPHPAQCCQIRFPSSASHHVINSLLEKLGDSCLLWWILKPFLRLSRLLIIWTYPASPDFLLFQVTANQTKLLTSSFQTRHIPISILFLLLLWSF